MHWQSCNEEFHFQGFQMVVSLSRTPHSMETDCWLLWDFWCWSMNHFGNPMQLLVLTTELPSSSSSSLSIAAERWKRVSRAWVWSSPFSTGKGATLCYVLELCYILELCSGERFVSLLRSEVLASLPFFWCGQPPMVRHLPGCPELPFSVLGLLCCRAVLLHPTVFSVLASLTRSAWVHENTNCLMQVNIAQVV